MRLGGSIACIHPSLSGGLLGWTVFLGWIIHGSPGWCTLRTLRGEVIRVIPLRIPGGITMNLDRNIVAQRGTRRLIAIVRARGVEIAESLDLSPRPIAPCDLGLPP